MLSLRAPRCAVKGLLCCSDDRMYGASTWKLACGVPRLAQREPRPTAKPVASSTSSRKRSRTGCVNPGIVSVAAAALVPAPCNQHAASQLISFAR